MPSPFEQTSSAVGRPSDVRARTRRTAHQRPGSQRRCRLGALPLAVLIALGLPACSDDDRSPEGTTEPFACEASQPWPYPSGIPYAGIHAGPRNDDLVDCDTSAAFQPSWHALRGHGLIQPNTFSADGRLVLATTTSPTEDGCRLHALDTQTGEVRWCQPGHPSLAAGSVLVDVDGWLYVAEADTVRSLGDDGSPRWSTRLDITGEPGLLSGLIGLHFTPDGHIATVDEGGTVFLIDRSDGRLLTTFDIPAAFGFTDLTEVSTSLSLLTLFPTPVRQDFVRTMGSVEEANRFLNAFLGFGGGFSDNTITVGPDGSLYVVGGGPDAESGALVQIRTSGEPEAPSLSAGWFVQTVGGSAATPSISRDGRWMVISDGASADNFEDPLPAHAILVDVAACDDLRDAATGPVRCTPARMLPLERGAMAGSPAILDGGEVILWELGSDLGSVDADARDVVSFGPDGLAWTLALPDGLDWTSIITVSRTHLIGTATRIVPSDRRIFRFRFPQSVTHRVIVVDRSTRDVVYMHPIPDDSAATVTVGPDGSLYVGMLGLVSHLALDTRPTLGLMRFAPTEP